MATTATVTDVPVLGMIIPEMGRLGARAGLAEALFTPVQRRVLGLLFGQPERSFQSAEVIRLARGAWAPFTGSWAGSPRPTS